MKPGIRWLTLAASLAMSASAIAAEVAGNLPPDDDFSPGLFFAVLFFIAVFLILVGIGIVIGLIVAACAALFVVFGIISSSALVAMCKRRLSAGFRALHYQVFALIALPCGIGATWVCTELSGMQSGHPGILLVGSVIGIAAGLSFAFILERFARFVYRRLFPGCHRTLSTGGNDSHCC